MAAEPAPEARPVSHRAPRPGGLRAEGLTVRYGGRTAVDAFSFEAPTHRATGLIGPNGAGKTTTFNACSGLVGLTAGRLELFGQDITGRRAPSRARLGLGRTFQRIELCDQLTVAANVSLGPESLAAGRGVFSQFRATAAQRASVQDAADSAIELCGLADRAGRAAGSLSTGERRLVQLARAIASDFDLLLLDEPSSGLDTTESEMFGQLLKSVQQRGTGLFLVEHDISLVRAVCDYVYVLDFGKLLIEGPTGATLNSEAVRNAYLGTGATHA
jgi:ABC-type branched-subunit amino acid transport system ATPase component